MFFSLLPSGIEPMRLVMLGIHGRRLDFGTMNQTWSVPRQRVRHTWVLQECEENVPVLSGITHLGPRG